LAFRPALVIPQSWTKAIRNLIKKSWDKLWTAYLGAIPLGSLRAPAQLPTIGYRPKIHLGASKATSSLITQIRTEKIGLNAFLVLYFCPEFADRRENLCKAAGTKDYSKMLATARGAKTAAQWLQRTGLLPQFSLGNGWSFRTFDFPFPPVLPISLYSLGAPHHPRKGTTIASQAIASSWIPKKSK